MITRYDAGDHMITHYDAGDHMITHYDAGANTCMLCIAFLPRC